MSHRHVSLALLLALALLHPPSAAQAAPPPPRTVAPAAPPVAAQVPAPAPGPHVVLVADSVPLGELCRLVYHRVLTAPYVASPEADADRRLVSLRLEGDRADVAARWASYLAGMGLTATTTAGVVRLAPTLPPPPPVPPPPRPPEPHVAFVYHPLHRDPDELAGALAALYPIAVRLSGGTPASVGASRDPAGATGAPTLQGILSGATTGAPTGTQPESAARPDAPTVRTTADSLALDLPRSIVSRVRASLAQLDRPVPVLVVRAALYEYTQTTGGPSVLQAIAQTAQGRASSLTALPSHLTLAADALSAVLSSLATDGRFVLADEPTALVKSGQTTRLTVGSDVPVQGSIAYAGASGTPVQSIEYKPSGTIITAQPTARASSIDVALHFEISDFAQTSTGVNSTPTLTKRSADTVMTLRDGEAVVVGGLGRRSSNSARTSMPGLPVLGGVADQTSRTDLVLILSVSRADNTLSPAPPPRITRPTRDAASAVASGLY